MNENSESRLNHIETILDRIAARQEADNQRIVSIERTIQAMLDERATERLKHEEKMARYDEIIAHQNEMLARVIKVQEGMAKMLEKIDETQPTILRKLTTIENKIDKLLDK